MCEGKLPEPLEQPLSVQAVAVWALAPGNSSSEWLKWRIHPQLCFKLQLLPLLVTDPDPDFMQLDNLIDDNHKDQGKKTQEP